MLFKNYSTRKFRRALLGLIVGAGIFFLFIWIVTLLKDLRYISSDVELAIIGFSTFLIAPIFIQWVMNKFEHPDDRKNKG